MFDPDDSDRPVTADDLQKLPYLTCVLEETMFSYRNMHSKCV